MKIKKVRICGFRGFNELREIGFNDQLTIIYGPNSYGKTSISEALEWLLHGETSKVENCVSGVNEFRGSYRNIHFPEDQASWVEVELIINDDELIVIKRELDNSGNTKRFLNAHEIQKWPWEKDGSKDNSPFILQHALQDILQTKPNTRYEKFSKILGTQELLVLQKEFNSLATKYNRPPEVEKFQSKILLLKEKIDSKKDLEKISKIFNNLSKNDLRDEMGAIINDCIPDFPSEKVFENEHINSQVTEILRSNKGELVSSVFDKDLSIVPFADDEKNEFNSCKNLIINFVSQEVIDDFFEIRKIKARQKFLEEANFFELGYVIFSKQKRECPFCGVEINEEIKGHIEKMHSQYEKETQQFNNLKNLEEKFNKKLNELNEIVNRTTSLVESKLLNYTRSNNQDDKEKIKNILGKDNSNEFQTILEDIETFTTEERNVQDRKRAIILAIDEVRNASDKSGQEDQCLENLNEKIVNFITDCEKLINDVNLFVDKNKEVHKIFLERLDQVAGTEILSLKIQICEQYEDIRKHFTIEQSIESLKELRSQVTNYVSEKTRSIVEKQLTQDVLDWYNLIKTDGDPDVHFSGFELGGTASRQQINVNAQSYGEPLVSAVSSLSESKLNALGLSIKIANNINSNSPFDFLVIDDPVQSLDDDHSTQFSSIVRGLIEQHNKQILLFSHSEEWLNHMRKGNESINGFYYHITGYTKSGPFISQVEWVDWKRRLSDIEAICRNPAESTIHLQHAEEEIRMVICQLTSEILEKKVGKKKNVNKLNEVEVRKSLLEAGVSNHLVDNLCQAFETVDDAHHSPNKYSAKKKRVESYCTWLHELAKQLN